MATKYGNESFDVEFMMPPDIMSIDSDINKIGALTPSPFTDGPGMDAFNLTSGANQAQRGSNSQY